MRLDMIDVTLHLISPPVTPADLECVHQVFEQIYDVVTDKARSGMVIPLHGANGNSLTSFHTRRFAKTLDILSLLWYTGFQRSLKGGLTMKNVVVQSNGVSDCLSALRYCGECRLCERVQRCKLPEAEEGRAALLDERIDKTQAHLDALKERRRELHVR